MRGSRSERTAWSWFPGDVRVAAGPPPVPRSRSGGPEENSITSAKRCAPAPRLKYAESDYCLQRQEGSKTLRLKRARVQNYWSIKDTGWFQVEHGKTILVGPNEAGKTAIFQALQQINPTDDVPKLSALRDYPRSLYSEDIASKSKSPSEILVASAEFALDAEDLEELPEGFQDATYTIERKLDNTFGHRINGGPQVDRYENISEELRLLAAHVDKQAATLDEPADQAAGAKLSEITNGWEATRGIRGDDAISLKAWLDGISELVNHTSATQGPRYETLADRVSVAERRNTAARTLRERLPKFVLFDNYFSVRPNIHLGHLADRLESNTLDDELYDYGNSCLLRLLGFTARELSEAAKVAEPSLNDVGAFEAYRMLEHSKPTGINSTTASTNLTPRARV